MKRDGKDMKTGTSAGSRFDSMRLLIPRLGLTSALALGLIASPLRAQNSAPPLQVAQSAVSMGQPSRWQPHVAAAVVPDPGGSGAAGSIALGAGHSVLSPVLGLLGVAGEAYAVVGGPHPGGGARVLAPVPVV